MVTHNWSNLFLDLVAGILADALGKEYYAGIAEKLLTRHGIRELEAAILEQAARGVDSHCSVVAQLNDVICRFSMLFPSFSDFFQEIQGCISLRAGDSLRLNLARLRS